MRTETIFYRRLLNKVSRRANQYLILFKSLSAPLSDRRTFRNPTRPRFLTDISNQERYLTEKLRGKLFAPIVEGQSNHVGLIGHERWFYSVEHFLSSFCPNDKTIDECHSQQIVCTLHPQSIEMNNYETRYMYDGGGGASVDRGILWTGELIVWCFSSCSPLSFFTSDIKSYAGGISSIRKGLYWVFGMMMGIATGERRNKGSFKCQRSTTKISAHHWNRSVPIVEQIFVWIDRNSRWAYRWQWRK